MSNVLWIGLLVVVIAVGIVVVRGRPDPQVLSATPAPASEAPSAEALAARAKLLTLLAGGKRVAFDPVVEDADTAEPASKFGGLPWLPEGTAWPVCPGCKKPMHFFVQLDVASLPREAGATGTGLLQLFTCTNWDSRSQVCLETYQHGSPSAVVRLVDSTRPGANAARALAAWPARRIVGWTPVEDYPGYDDLDELGIRADDDFLDLYEAAAAEDQAPAAHQGDKLGGWPYWVQNPEYGACRECGKRMHVVLQLDSEDNVPHMFGDAGAGHVSQCPDHPHVLVWGWACH